MGKPSQAAIDRYRAEKYDVIRITVKKGEKEALKEAAASSGAPSLNAFILHALEKETGRKLILDGELPTLKKHEQPTTEQPGEEVP